MLLLVFCVFKSSFFPCVIESVVVIVVIFLNVSSGAFVVVVVDRMRRILGLCHNEVGKTGAAG